MSLGRKLAVVTGVLGVLSSLTGIIGFLFDHGHQTEYVVFGWVDEWGHAADSKPWVLWCGLALALVGLVLAVGCAWDGGLLEGWHGLFWLGVCVALCSIILVNPNWHILTWVGYGEIWIIY